MRILNILLSLSLFAFVACNNSGVQEQKVAEELDKLTEAVEQIAEEVEEPVDMATKLLGKWNYVETITTVGETTVNIKAVESWTMEFKEGGGYYEEQIVAEGMEPGIFDSTFKVEGNKLIREGAVEVEIVEITDTKLTILSMGSKMIFEKM